MGFLFHKHSKFWSISLEDWVDQKPFISQECQAIYIKNEWFLGQFGFINHSFAQLTVHRRLTQTLQTEWNYAPPSDLDIS